MRGLTKIVYAEQTVKATAQGGQDKMLFVLRYNFWHMSHFLIFQLLEN